MLNVEASGLLQIVKDVAQGCLAYEDTRLKALGIKPQW